MRTQTQLISDPKDLYRFLATAGIEVASLLFAGATVCWISWRHANEAHAPVLRHTNVDIASFVTAGGKMHVYTYLDNLRQRALYVEADSVLFIQLRDGATSVNTGDRLGDMTSELKLCEYISEFGSGSPKNYAYQTHNTGAEATVCKVRGITLNYSASQLVKFESMKKLILRGTETYTVTIHTAHKIKRKRCMDDDGMIRIVNEPEDKTYRVSFLKRRRLQDNTSVPFGYIKGS